MHAEQAIERLKNCDAIIYAKEMKQPSITGPEKDMLMVADAEDPSIRVSDINFVVLTQADALDDQIDFKDTYEKHQCLLACRTRTPFDSRMCASAFGGIWSSLWRHIKTFQKCWR